MFYDPCACACFCAVLCLVTQFSSAQFSNSIVSDCLWPNGLQHARPPCPSPIARAYSNSCPLSKWCHPTISSSVVPFSSCPQSFPASGSFQMSQLFPSGSQSISISASTSVLPMNIQDRFFFRMDWLDLLAVAQLCPTLCDPTDCSPPGSSVHGILQTRILEWVAIPFSRGSSWPRGRTWVSHIGGRLFTVWATREALPNLYSFLTSADFRFCMLVIFFYMPG